MVSEFCVTLALGCKNGGFVRSAMTTNGNCRFFPKAWARASLALSGIPGYKGLTKKCGKHYVQSNEHLRQGLVNMPWHKLLHGKVILRCNCASLTLGFYKSEHAKYTIENWKKREYWYLAQAINWTAGKNFNACMRTSYLSTTQTAVCGLYSTKFPELRSRVW